MTNINRDMIASAARANIFAISRTDFLDTLNAHDDADHFAELDLIELADDLDNAILTHLPTTASDDDIDAFADAHYTILTTPDDAAYIKMMILDAINIRIQLSI